MDIDCIDDWFYVTEDDFSTFGIFDEKRRYEILRSALTDDVFFMISDVLNGPGIKKSQDRYNYLKGNILRREHAFYYVEEHPREGGTPMDWLNHLKATLPESERKYLIEIFYAGIDNGIPEFLRTLHPEDPIEQLAYLATRLEEDCLEWP